MIASLTNGGIPISPDMLYIVASFMHMLLLNQDTTTLLIESQFMVHLCKICLNPQKYHRYVSARGRDDFNSEQMLQYVANANIKIAAQMFETLLMISDELIPRSHSLLLEYVSMDKQLRVLEKELTSD